MFQVRLLLLFTAVLRNDLAVVSSAHAYSLCTSQAGCSMHQRQLCEMYTCGYSIETFGPTEDTFAKYLSIAAERESSSEGLC